MGRALLPSPFLASVAMATPLLEAVGGAAERERWLPGLCEGTLVASVGLAEPDWRDPYAAPTLRARFVGVPDTSEDEVILDGTKCFVPFAPDADVLIVSVDGGRLARVERGAAGLRYRRQTTLGGDPVYAVQLVGTPAVILGTGKADCAAALRAALDRGAVASFAYALGAAERALELSVDHAKTREQFGRPIGSFQAVAHRCVDMRSDLDALRYLVYQAAWNLAQHAGAPLVVAAARAFGIEALRNVERHAHQVHGAIGFSTEHDLHLYTRRAKATELMWGSISRAREEVASAMGL
jgi:alkylation response protein AidB-like acyl-CoA dehydrogenase